MAVSISGTTGTWSHGTTGITISGSGFGTKDHAAPHAWDDCAGTPNDHTAVNTIWSGHWPNSHGTAANNMQYSAAFRSQPMPNARVSQYLRGVHNGSSSSSGWNVAVWKNFTIADGMAILFDWHNYTDEDWVRNGSPDDGNYKEFGYSVQGSIYELPNNWYQSLWEILDPTDSTYSWIINDDSSGDGFSTTGNIFWGSGSSMQTPIGNWRHYRNKMRVDTNGTAGYIKTYQNNVGPIVNYSNYLDHYSGTGRSIGVGGYARSFGDTNVRYFWGIYADYEPGTVEVPHVIVANNATFASATKYEHQIPSAWSDTSITVKCNLGGLDDGTAYLFVVASDGSTNATGFSITAGGDEEPPPQAFTRSRGSMSLR